MGLVMMKMKKRALVTMKVMTVLQVKVEVMMMKGVEKSLRVSTLEERLSS